MSATVLELSDARQKARDLAKSAVWADINEETCFWVCLSQLRAYFGDGKAGVLEALERVQVSGAWNRLDRDRQIAVMAFAAGASEALDAAKVGL